MVADYCNQVMPTCFISGFFQTTACVTQINKPVPVAVAAGVPASLVG